MCIKIEVDTAFENCDKCRWFKLEKNEAFANRDVWMTYYKCKFVDVCRNAEYISKMESESDREGR